MQQQPNTYQNYQINKNTEMNNTQNNQVQIQVSPEDNFENNNNLQKEQKVKTKLKSGGGAAKNGKKEDNSDDNNFCLII